MGCWLVGVWVVMLLLLSLSSVRILLLSLASIGVHSHLLLAIGALLLCELSLGRVHLLLLSVGRLVLSLHVDSSSVRGGWSLLHLLLGWVGWLRGIASSHCLGWVLGSCVRWLSLVRGSCRLG